ncbi:3-oxoacyl-ACP synthase III family protein [Bacillus cereus group sp. MYBK108-2]|uniref:3-oxoacyl-ACP synthase III family protein n=1 Tax=unclassified Bacillus cereus group TaxID=2750818 RepID=UPI0028924E31|nr:hypothetical protein [Bacillus cereus]HEF1897124.1 hypothetical protein [Bacillus cereus]
MSGSFGIKAIGSSLGERFELKNVVSNYTSNPERVYAWGYEHVHIATKNKTQTELAFEAANEAIKKAQIQAEDLDVIIFSVSDISEYLYWDSAAELQHQLGAKNAEVILLTQACTSGLASFELMAGKFAINSDYKNGLLVMSNKCCETYRNRVTYNASFRSDGAVAAVVQRNYQNSKWLASKNFTDGTYSTLFKLDVGGEVEPFSSGNIHKLSSHSTLAQLRSFFATDPLGLLDFIELIHRRNREMTEEACKKAGIKLSDLSKIIYLHDNQESLKTLARHFEVPIEQINASLSAQYGHMGVADQLFDYNLYLENNELNSGDYVALVGFGSGMHWMATILQV